MTLFKNTQILLNKITHRFCSANQAISKPSGISEIRKVGDLDLGKYCISFCSTDLDLNKFCISLFQNSLFEVRNVKIDESIQWPTGGKAILDGAGAC